MGGTECHPSLSFVNSVFEAEQAGKLMSFWLPCPAIDAARWPLGPGTAERGLAKGRGPALSPLIMKDAKRLSTRQKSLLKSGSRSTLAYHQHIFDRTRASFAS